MKEEIKNGQIMKEDSCSLETAQAYQKPDMEVFDIQLEGSILQDSLGTDDPDLWN